MIKMLFLDVKRSSFYISFYNQKDIKFNKHAILIKIFICKEIDFLMLSHLSKFS